MVRTVLVLRISWNQNKTLFTENPVYSCSLSRKNKHNDHRQVDYVGTTTSSVSSGSAPHTWTRPSMAVSRQHSVGWKDSDWTTAFPTGSFKDRDPWKKLNVSALTGSHILISAGEAGWTDLSVLRCHKYLVTYLHEVPAVDVSVLWAAQDVGVFTGQAAVQLVALHLVPCIPEPHTKT